MCVWVLVRPSCPLPIPNLTGFPLTPNHPFPSQPPSTPPSIQVGCRTKLDKSKLKPGTRVALDMTTLTIMRQAGHSFG